MLKHIVMWKFKDEAEGKSKAENCRYVKERLEALPAKISIIRKLEVGINEYPSPAAADMVLVTEFASKEDLDSYAVNPDHVKVSEYIGKVRLDRVVADYIV
ncbi:MAG TPA: Dabb family protein [Treponemataceae bacterium]|nr:Dabb family protein [Treponemataceae bacterium]HPS43414.1 Dabb family protein [Treponemataceae bacterium]